MFYKVNSNVNGGEGMELPHTMSQEFCKPRARILKSMKFYQEGEDVLPVLYLLGRAIKKEATSTMCNPHDWKFENTKHIKRLWAAAELSSRQIREPYRPKCLQMRVKWLKSKVVGWPSRVRWTNCLLLKHAPALSSRSVNHFLNQLFPRVWSNWMRWGKSS